MEERLEQIKHKRFFNIGGGSDQVFNFEDLRWLIEQAEKLQRIKQLLEYGSTTDVNYQKLVEILKDK